MVVHLLGLIILLSPASARMRYGAYRPPPSYGSSPILAGPAVFVIGPHRPGKDGSRLSSSGGPFNETGCPAPPLVDVEAVPAFPLIGGRRPFQDVGPVRANPAFCVRIDRNGRVRAAWLANDGTGDPARDRRLRLEMLNLRFLPALRDRAPVTAWHRVTVNLPVMPVPREPGR